MQIVVTGFAVKIYPLMHLSQRNKLHFLNDLIQIFFSPKQLPIISFFPALLKFLRVFPLNVLSWRFPRGYYCSHFRVTIHSIYMECY